ncbi:hypothetical protein ACF8OH_03670 [Delftia sp. WSY_9]|uniref:hypothetical protein n=1 Tax=unclassified Delftia TaxID=2613839 RepID=UPI003709E620
MTPSVNLLPAIYLDADVRNVTPVCPGRKRLGLGLDIPGQPTVRVAITLEHAQFLRDSLNDYISAAAGGQRASAVLAEGE